MVEADKLKAELGVEEKKSATVKESIVRQTADIEVKSKTLQSRLEELTKERAEIAGKIIDTVRGGSPIFAYYPEKSWLENSLFLQHGVTTASATTMAAALR